jgi:hypothetical protein
MSLSVKVIALFFCQFFLFSSFTIGEDLPPVNKKILEYCNLNMGKQIDRGECWDLLRFALDYAKADWSAPLDFGEPLNHKTEEILPGDIVKFKNVKFVYPNGSTMTMSHHFAIVYEVDAEGKYTLIHQNVNGARYLKTNEIDLNYMKKGKISFFRPKES